MAEMTAEEKYRQQEEELDKKLNSLSDDDLPTANIIVAGITGTGKSTLINAVFGSELAKTGTGRPVTEHIDEYYKNDLPVRIWDTVGLELDSEKTEKSIASIKETIAKRADTEDQFDRIHAIWYCINAASNRYQGAELKFIKELHDTHLPFIIVLTQCFGAKQQISAFENKIKEINCQEGMGDIGVIRTLAMDYAFELDEDNVIHKPAFGLDDLVNETLRRLPEFIKSGFIAAQRVSKDQKREHCEDIIYEYAMAAQNGFWDKVPLINILTTDRKILKMFMRISQMYNTVLSEESISRITTGSTVDFKNNFFGLVAPDYLSGYNAKINALLDAKKNDGFSVKVYDIPENYRAARMIAFFGYTFIDSIEELWKKLTEKQLQDVDMVVNNLTRIINNKLKEHKLDFEKLNEKKINITVHVNYRNNDSNQSSL